MPGYALLPTLDKPVSTQTFRLTQDEMQERNAWIIDADKRGMSHDEIAKEVGLSKQRVYQIIGPKNPTGPRGYCQNKAKVQPKRFNTPEEAALDEYRRLDLDCSCQREKRSEWFGGDCMKCSSYLGMRGMDFDSDGWPIYECDRRFIEPHMVQPNATRWNVYWTFCRNWHDRGEEHTMSFDDKDEAEIFCWLINKVLKANRLDSYWAGVSEERYKK